MKKVMIAAIAACVCASAFAFWPFRPVRPVRPRLPRPPMPKPPIEIRVEPKDVTLVFNYMPTQGVYVVEQSYDLQTWTACSNRVDGAKCFFRVVPVEDK